MLLLRSWGRQLAHYEQFCAPLPRLGAMGGGGGCGGSGSDGGFSPLPASAASTPRSDRSPSESPASPPRSQAGSPPAAQAFGQLPPASPPPPLQSGAGRVGASVLSSAGGRLSAAGPASGTQPPAIPRAAAASAGGTRAWGVGEGQGPDRVARVVGGEGSEGGLGGVVGSVGVGFGVGGGVDVSGPGRGREANDQSSPMRPRALGSGLKTGVCGSAAGLGNLVPAS